LELRREKTVAKWAGRNNLPLPEFRAQIPRRHGVSIIHMTFTTFFILAQATATPAPTVRPPDQGMSMMVWMIFAFVLIYFLTIRPQSMKQKQLQAQIASLKTGDKVVTNGGIHGLVANIQDGPTLTLKIADNVKIEVEKSAVTTIVRPAAETKAA
jgi:preprotein translocase subunit YajC